MTNIRTFGLLSAFAADRRLRGRPARRAGPAGRRRRRTRGVRGACTSVRVGARAGRPSGPARRSDGCATTAAGGGRSVAPRGSGEGTHLRHRDDGHGRVPQAAGGPEPAGPDPARHAARRHGRLEAAGEAARSSCTLAEGVRIDPAAKEAHGISEEDCARYGVSGDGRLLALQSGLSAGGHHRRPQPLLRRLDHEDGAVPTRHEAPSPRRSPAGLHEGSDRPTSSSCPANTATSGRRSPRPIGTTPDEELAGAHDALVDTEACLVIFRALVETGVVELDRSLSGLRATRRFGAVPRKKPRSAHSRSDQSTRSSESSRRDRHPARRAARHGAADPANRFRAGRGRHRRVGPRRRRSAARAPRAAARPARRGRPARPPRAARTRPAGRRASAGDRGTRHDGFDPAPIANPGAHPLAARERRRRIAGPGGRASK